VLGHLGVGADLGATVARWTRTMLLLTLALAVVSVLLRVPIAQAVGVKNHQWAAAIGLPAAGLWLELSVLRGVLQGIGDYKGVGVSLVGEQATRLVVGAALAAGSLGVTGAYLGTPLSFIAVGIFCMVRLREHIERGRGPAGGPEEGARSDAHDVDPRQAGVGADRRARSDRAAPPSRRPG